MNEQTRNGRNDMRTTWCVILIAASAMIGMIDVLHAQPEENSGRNEFLRSCASCHGVSGKGDGPVAKSLSPPPSDLTRLSEANNGVFPPEISCRRNGTKQLSDGVSWLWSNTSQHCSERRAGIAELFLECAVVSACSAAVKRGIPPLRMTKSWKPPGVSRKAHWPALAGGRGRKAAVRPSLGQG